MKRTSTSKAATPPTPKAALPAHLKPHDLTTGTCAGFWEPVMSFGGDVIGYRCRCGKVAAPTDAKRPRKCPDCGTFRHYAHCDYPARKAREMSGRIKEMQARIVRQVKEAEERRGRADDAIALAQVKPKRQAKLALKAERLRARAAVLDVMAQKNRERIPGLEKRRDEYLAADRGKAPAMAAAAA